MTSAIVRCAFISLACGTMALKCKREPEAYRGPGLEVAPLAAADIVGAYRAALASSFTLGDPTLSLLVDPVFLPRGEGLAGGDSMPRALRSTLERHGLTKGTCQLPVQRNRTALVCRATRPGYVVRFSQPLALGGRQDSVQVHLVVQQYAIPRGPVAERLRFERAYHVARRGQTWRAVREARLPQP
jgi:hypothetical protein